MPNKAAAVMNLCCCLMLSRVAGLTDSRGRRGTELPAKHMQCSHDSYVHQSKLHELMGHCWSSDGASTQRAALHARGRHGSTWQHLHRQTPGMGFQGQRHTQQADCKGARTIQSTTVCKAAYIPKLLQQAEHSRRK